MSDVGGVSRVDRSQVSTVPFNNNSIASRMIVLSRQWFPESHAAGWERDGHTLLGVSSTMPKGRELATNSTPMGGR